MRKILFVILLSLVITGCNNKKEYNKKITKCVELMTSINSVSGIIANDYSDVWKTTIYDNKYDGKYCSDFNEAIYKRSEVIKELNIYKDNFAKLDSLSTLIKELKDYPSSYKEAYDNIVSIYTDVDQLAGYAASPSGSLSTYSKSTTELFISISKKLKEFNIKYIEN